MLKRTGGDLEQQAQMERDYQLNKLINGKCEEQLKIDDAKRRWRRLRKKKKIILQMSNIGMGEMQKMILKKENTKVDQ